mmetsp:Transcript_16864/g.37843  ORF Transcript_16864/g.37843 Transcript_16864/m.37843 type:complete len:459 (-) Transcript_16864:118-1494(-)
MAASQEELQASEGDAPPPSLTKRPAEDELEGPPPEKQPRGEDPPQSEGDNGAAAPEPVEAGAQPFEAGQGEVAPTDPPALAAAPAPGSTAPGIGLIGAAMLRQPNEAAKTPMTALPGVLAVSNGGGSTDALIPRGLKGVVMRPPVVGGAVAGAGEAPTGACSKGSFTMASLLANKGCGKGMFPSSAASLPTSLSFEIPAKRVKDILGVKGTNIKALKMLSRISKIDLQDRSDPATVTVHGSQEACEKAKHMVLSIAAGDQSVIGNIVETIDVDQRLVSKLIGAKGAAINQIKDASGCYLEVRETGNGTPPRVIMTGPRDAVERAKDLVMRFLIEQTAAVNQQAAVAAAGLPGLGDPLAALGLDAQAQLQQLMLQAQLAQLGVGAGGLSMPGLPQLPPELALQLQQQAQALQLAGQPQQQDAQMLQQAMMQQAQLTGFPGMGFDPNLGMGFDPNAPQGF